MLEFLQKMLQDTIKSGTGQAIIAFGAWLYVPVLVLAAIYNAAKCLISLSGHKRNP